MAKILSIKDLHVDVASTPIINGLNLEIESGETHAIMGPNGSGKSTLAKTIAGHPDYKIKSGEITYMDHDLNDLQLKKDPILVSSLVFNIQLKFLVFRIQLS